MGSAIEFVNPILAGVTLVREAIQSQNYQAGTAGWQVAADGTAEFSDLTIRSSDGSGNTVTVANGRITIRTAAGVRVIEIDSDGYRIYRPDGEIVADLKLDGGFAFGGLYTRDFGSPAVYSFLQGGALYLGPADTSQSDIPAFLQYSIDPTAPVRYSVITLSSGMIDTATDDECRLQLISEPGQRSRGWIDGGGSTVDANLNVTGSVVAKNIRAGRNQTPAPGAGGGTTSVNVTFSSPMDTLYTTTPRITLSPDTTVDPGSVTIRAYVDNVTSTGFTIRCYRSTNAATNFMWTAIAEAL